MSDKTQQPENAPPQANDPGPGMFKQRSFLMTSLPFFILAHAAHHLLTALPQPMLPYIQEEFGLNYTRSAAILSAFALSSGAAQLPAGWLADRFGPTILITLGIVGVALAGLFVGLSHTYFMLLVCLVFMGIMAGGYHPASTPADIHVRTDEHAWQGIGVASDRRQLQFLSGANRCSRYRRSLGVAGRIPDLGDPYGHPGDTVLFLSEQTLWQGPHGRDETASQH